MWVLWDSTSLALKFKFFWTYDYVPTFGKFGITSLNDEDERYRLTMTDLKTDIIKLFPFIYHFLILKILNMVKRFIFQTLEVK